MAIQKYLEKPKIAEYNGMKIGVREPTTGEMLEITKVRQAYLKTVKDDPYGDGEGEISLFLDLQREASKLLSCDPDDSTNPWFATDSDDQKRLEKNGVSKDLAEEVPHKFHSAVWNTLIGVGGSAPLESPEMSQNPAATDSEITSNSTPSSSESASISDAQSEKSNSGNGDDSSTELSA